MNENENQTCGERWVERNRHGDLSVSFDPGVISWFVQPGNCGNTHHGPLHVFEFDVLRWPSLHPLSALLMQADSGL